MDEESHLSTGRRSSFCVRVMFSFVALVIVSCFIVALYHAYSHWLNRTARRRRQLSLSASTTIGAELGLDARDMNSLPTFIYDSKSHKGEESLLECAVCLSEFEDNETGRILPACKHCFHVDCIDMWLLSHSLCPLCRSQVQVVQPVKDPVDPPVEYPNEIIIPVIVTGTSADMGSGLEHVPKDGSCYIGSSSSQILTDRTGQDPSKNVVDPHPDIKSAYKPTDWIGSCVKQVV